jgi:hypothetical protein
MAQLAQRLERACPKPFDIAAMRLNVITDQLRSVHLNAAAEAAGEQVARQDREAQPLPARRLVEPTAGIMPITAAITLALAVLHRCIANPWRNGAQLRADQTNFAHWNNRKAPIEPDRGFEGELC